MFAPDAYDRMPELGCEGVKSGAQTPLYINLNIVRFGDSPMTGVNRRSRKLQTTLLRISQSKIESSLYSTGKVPHFFAINNCL